MLLIKSLFVARKNWLSLKKNNFNDSFEINKINEKVSFIQNSQDLLIVLVELFLNIVKEFKSLEKQVM